MVHNGIEYGDMQMICEAYDLMQASARHEARGDGRRSSREWNKGVLDSFLIEITADILKQKDPVTKQALRRLRARHRRPEGHRQVDVGQRARHGRARADDRRGGLRALLSALKDERVAASKILKGPTQEVPRRRRRRFVDAIHDALYCSKICSYAQGFQLMREAQKEYNWKLNFGEIAQIWRGGCIIRARSCRRSPRPTQRNPNLANLLLDPYFNKTVQERRRTNWRKVVALAASAACRCRPSVRRWPTTTATARRACPANLLQAQRDYFGAHTYERVDQPRGQVLPHRLARKKSSADRGLTLAQTSLSSRTGLPSEVARCPIDHWKTRHPRRRVFSLCSLLRFLPTARVEAALRRPG